MESESVEQSSALGGPGTGGDRQPMNGMNGMNGTKRFKASSRVTRTRVAWVLAATLGSTFFLSVIAIAVALETEVFDLGMAIASDVQAVFYLLAFVSGVVGFQWLLVLPVFPLRSREGLPSKWRSVAVGVAGGFWIALACVCLLEITRSALLMDWLPQLEQYEHMQLWTILHGGGALGCGFWFRHLEVRDAISQSGPGHGVSMKLTIAAAALVASALTVGGVAALAGAITSIFTHNNRWPGVGELGLYLLAGVAAVWCLWGWLLWRWKRGQDPGSWLSRWCSRLFIGSVIEVLASLPTVALSRHRGNCYCDDVSFAALVVGWSAGLIMFGPVVFLLPLGRRMRRLDSGRCRACGYDMSGNPRAARCPECGAGWRSERVASEQAAGT